MLAAAVSGCSREALRPNVHTWRVPPPPTQGAAALALFLPQLRRAAPSSVGYSGHRSAAEERKLEEWLGSGLQLAPPTLPGASQVDIDGVRAALPVCNSLQQHSMPSAPPPPPCQATLCLGSLLHYML